MKRRFYYLLVCLLSFYTVSGQSFLDQSSFKQTFTPTSPNTTALGQHAMNPPDFSNGQPQQVIDLYEIKEKDISYSLKLLYNYSGFKLNEGASSVGLGWCLTDGVIIRVAKHVHDDAYLLKKFESFGNDLIEEWGVGHFENFYVDPTMRDSEYNLTANRLFNKLYDAQPDLYIYNFNGYSGKFIYINSRVINLEYNDLIITRVGWNFVITTPDGIKYSFTEYEKANSGSGSHCPQACPGIFVTISPGNIYTSAWVLSEIESNNTKAKISIDYNLIGTGSPSKVETILSFVAPLEHDGQYRISSHTMSDFPSNPVASHLIKEIRSDNHYVKFDSSPSNDGTSSLNTICVYDNTRTNLIRTISFNYGYFGNISNTNTCWLKLKSININGAGRNEEYKFTYVNESTQNSYLNKTGKSIDHWGYYNGAINTTLLPFTTDINYFFQIHKPSGWNPYISWANREPNLTHAKYFALETIQYPTGGSTTITYESSRGKGIRVASQKDYDGEKYITKSYKYYPDNNIVPNYYSSQYDMSSCCHIQGSPEVELLFATFSSSLEGADSFLGNEYDDYSRVIEYIGTPYDNKGYTEYNYEYFGVLWTNKKFLTRKTTYNSNSVIVAQEKFFYAPVDLETIYHWRVPKLLHIGSPGICYVDVTGTQSCCPADPLSGYHYILGQLDLGIECVNSVWYKLYQTENLLDGVSTVSTYEYSGNNHKFKTKETFVKSNGISKTINYRYPAEYSNITPYNGMCSIHMIAPVVQMEEYSGNNLIQTIRTNYQQWNNNIVAPLSIETTRDGNTSIEVTYNNYDAKGNPVQITKKNGIVSSYLWDNTGNYLMAQVEGINYSGISMHSGKSADYSSKALFNDLKITAPNAFVTTYKYKPFIGVSEITNPLGTTKYYEYDLFGRLNRIKDDDLNIVEQYNYHYKQ